MPFGENTVVAITDEKWGATRRSLQETSGRFAELLSAVADSRAKATVHWSVAETAAHVVTLAQACSSMVGSGPSPEVADLFSATIVDTVDVLNDALLTRYTERDLATLARLVPALAELTIQHGALCL